MASPSSLRKRLEARIERAIQHLRNGSFRAMTQRTEREQLLDAARIAETYERTIVGYVNELVDKRLRRAVLERPTLVDRWGLHDHSDEGISFDERRNLSDLAVAEHVAGVDPGEPFWPTNVAPTDIALALERMGHPEAAPLVTALRSGGFFPGGPSRVVSALPELYTEPTNFEDHATGKTVTREKSQVAPELAHALSRWPIRIAALIVSVEKLVQADREKGHIPIGASKRARAAIQLVSGHGPWIRDPKAPAELAPRFKDGRVELVWDGTPRQYQLALPMGSDRFEVEILEGILHELKEDGLRDWLIFHRMAAEHGRKGSFVWSWREHRERTSYDRRIQNDNKGDAETRDAVVRRLWRFKTAEIRETEMLPGGARKWRRIGPFGLIDIPGAIDIGESLELAVIVLNPALYEGTKKGTTQPNFALLSNEALRLDGSTLRLGAILSLEMRYRRDYGGVVARKAATLWRDAGIRGGKPKRKEWPRADVSLANALERLVEAEVISSWSRETGEAGPDAVYEIRPTAAWCDQLLHAVPPSLPIARSELPGTGGEFREWREHRGLSQSAVAEALGVGIATVKRAEREPSSPLGAAIYEAIRRYRPADG